MLFWSKPDEHVVEEVLRAESLKNFTHEGLVRISRDVRSAAELEDALRSLEEDVTFDVDHLRTRLGIGPECFARAKQAMIHWKMLQAPSWLEICWPHSPIREGQTMGTLILSMGLYSLTTCRIVYTVDQGPMLAQATSLPEAAYTMAGNDSDGRAAPDALGFRDVLGVERFGFAWGTLPTHLVAGEERFMVEWDKSDDSVWFELLSFSKPRHWMAKLGYPMARMYQEEYHKATAQAMLQAVEEESVAEPDDSC